MFRCAPLLLALIAGVPAALAVDEAPEFADVLGTLPLDQELDARGNLGGVAVDRLGFVYVANFRDALWRISPDGQVTTLTRSLYGSSGVAIDARGDVLQANFFGNTITRIRRTGEVEPFVTEGLNGPVGIAIGPDDLAYVCNCTGNTLSRITREGVAEPFAESDLFACPNGISFGGDGALYVTNFNNHEILRVTTDGEVGRFATVPGGAGNAHIAYSKGFFYVTKIIANRLVKIAETGEITPLAGTGQPGHDDGSALTASLHRPNGIAVSPAGDLLYVNTLVGEYSKPQRSRITVRTVELMTLTEALEEAWDRGGPDAVRAAYGRYRSDPVRGRENTAGEMISYGYSFLRDRKAPEALLIFGLNAASYPDNPAAQFHLGEAHRYIGQADRAIAQYEQVLKLDPEHAAAKSRLSQLRGDGD